MLERVGTAELTFKLSCDRWWLSPLQLNMFSTEVVRIAREIADGNLNVRAEVEAVEGTLDL